MNLDELKELEAKATPGLWKLSKDGEFDEYTNENSWWYTGIKANKKQIIYRSDDEGNEKYDCDITFITELRNAFPEIVEEIKRLRAENKTMADELSIWVADNKRRTEALRVAKISLEYWKDKIDEHDWDMWGPESGTEKALTRINEIEKGGA